MKKKAIFSLLFKSPQSSPKAGTQTHRQAALRKANSPMVIGAGGLNRAIFSIVICSAFSCNQPAEFKWTKENLTDSISAKETVLKKLEVLTPDNSFATDIIKLYRQFADSFPNEKAAPDYLFKAANVSIGVRQFNQAISFLERIKENFPAYEKSAESLFFMAFIYDNYLEQKGRASEIYEEVIQKYPEHKFASEAKEVLKTLSMSDEELIRMFQAKEKDGNQPVAAGKGK